MIYINLLTHLKQKLFEKQLPEDLFHQGFVFEINSKKDIIWDLVIVYEDIDEPWFVKYKENGLLFISGEPPFVKVYSEKFLSQFNYIISAHPEIKHSNNFLIQQSLPWYFGYDFANNAIDYTFEDLVKMAVPVKNKKISFITSNRTFLPGHNSRVKFCEELQKRYSGYIDFYGKGFHPVNDKAEAIMPYYFSICIENSNIDNYWTEKIADAFLGFSVPVYYGCKNIHSYFPEDSFISMNIKDKKTTFSIIENLIRDTEVIYEKIFSHMMESRKKCLYQYNIFYSMMSFAQKYIRNQVSDKIINIQLQSSTTFHDSDMANKFLKIRRIALKRIDKTFHW
ncbi:MAG: hypothetical protein LBV74_22665 [Tannerella sp.]|jgi:hypothetical protein|nr:hypothetical protein [Tannerella sp.]